MAQIKLKNYLLVINLTKQLSLILGTFSAFLCWMFEVAATVSLLHTDQSGQRDSFLITASISDNLATFSILFLAIGVILAVIYFLQGKKVAKNSLNIPISVISLSLFLVVTLVFRDNILHRLILNNLG